MSWIKHSPCPCLCASRKNEAKLEGEVKMTLHRITAMCSLVATGFVLSGEANGDQPYGQFTGNIKPIIYVTDVEKSAPFYRDVLGFVLDGFAGEEADPYYAEMLAGPTKFGLHEPTMSGDDLRVGQQRLYFRVHDLIVHRRYVESRGVEIKEIFHRSWMDYFVVQDIDGNIIASIQARLSRLSRRFAGFVYPNGFVLHRILRQDCFFGRFSHVDGPFEPCAILHDDSGAKNIAFNIGAFGQRDSPIASDVPDKRAFDDYCRGVNVCLNPALLADR
jgi:catechol 2,3-dioxygenase-like lactoylglutathione lyase family enzyme